MENRKILILGSKGMLGQMVNKYFTYSGFGIHIYDDPFTHETIERYVAALNEFDDGIIINCIGKIKQKTESTHELFLSNSLFPLELNRSLKSGHILIHPSTDCVFNGRSEKPYSPFEKHTASDIYGISKSLGEAAVMSRPNSLVIRVSIIGPDSNSPKGLLSWFLSNSPKAKLNGYTNHYWNGITTLEWCKRVRALINDDKYIIKNHLVQLGTSQSYSKYEMLCEFQRVFNTDFEINAFESGEKINRCLIPMIVSKSLDLQLEELKEFMIAC